MSATPPRPPKLSIYLMAHPPPGTNPADAPQAMVEVDAGMTLADLESFAHNLTGVKPAEQAWVHLQARRLLTRRDPLLACLTEQGVAQGDVVAVAPQSALQNQQQQQQQPTQGRRRSNQQQRGAASTRPVFFRGMTIQEVLGANPSPRALAEVLRTHDEAWALLNHVRPTLAASVRAAPTLEEATTLLTRFLQELALDHSLEDARGEARDREMQERLARDPNDAEAKIHVERMQNLRLMDEQLMHINELYPEQSVGAHVVMLYVAAEFNGHKLNVFVDTGAAQSILTYKCAERCGLLPMVDTRYKSKMVGVGSHDGMGRLHMAYLKCGGTVFPMSLNVMAPRTASSEHQLEDVFELLLGLCLLYTSDAADD